jgi:hypothetical protein
MVSTRLRMEKMYCHEELSLNKFRKNFGPSQVKVLLHASLYFFVQCYHLFRSILGSWKIASYQGKRRSVVKDACIVFKMYVVISEC